MCQKSALVLLLFAAGCGPAADALISVTGKVKFADGSVPTGEVTDIRFDPADPTVGPAKNVPPRPASATFQPDGSFQLTTDGNEGALAGKYKVVVMVLKSRGSPTPGVPVKYTRTETTPLEATVTPGGDNDFKFVLDKQ
jgi:hypothetical protein